PASSHPPSLTPSPPPPPLRVLLAGPGCGDEEEAELEIGCVFWSPTAEEKTTGEAAVSWRRNGQALGDAHLVAGGRSQLKVTRESWEKGDVYTCEVTA
ncbi:hypothetical protein, partial [Klebsiella pneumoniae]|uniref:hypothetical protein n=1 Tax=Klebsiella pneumoniae TaxID=573 RepID=UPI00210BCCFB